LVVAKPMKGPLYWLLVNSEEKPAARHLSREPVVWLYLIGNAVWGLACIMADTRSQSLEHDAFLIAAVKLTASILTLSLPTVILTLREADKDDHKCSFYQFVGSVWFGLLVAVFLGACLEFLLSILGIQHFLGIPIEKWN